jgi:hypothetical protein
MSCSCVLGIVSRQEGEERERGATHTNSLRSMFRDQSCKTFDTHGVRESENIGLSQQRVQAEDDPNRYIAVS